MKLLLDECVVRDLKKDLVGYEVELIAITAASRTACRGG